MKKKKLFDYTAGYRGLIILGILCSAGEAVLELLLPQVMSDIVDIGIQNGDRDYILMAGLKMVLMALVALALGVGAAVLASKAGMGFGANLRAAEYRQVQRFSFANIPCSATEAACRRKYPLFMRGERNIVISHNMEYNIDGGIVSAGDKARRRRFRNPFSFALPFSPIAAPPAASASGGAALFMGSARKISFFYIESSQMLWYNRYN